MTPDEEGSDEWLEKNLFPISDKISDTIAQAIHAADAPRVQVLLQALNELATIAAHIVNCRREGKGPEEFCRTLSVLESCMVARFPEVLSPMPEGPVPPAGRKPRPGSWH